MPARTEPPPALLVARRALDALPEVELLEEWQLIDGGGRGEWQLKVRLRPSALGDVVPVPEETDWYVVAQSVYPKGFISILPATEKGLPGFFPHQMRELPDQLPGVPWRNRKVCVATDSENNLYRTGDEEPRGERDRLRRHVSRALSWLEAASRDELLAEGDPFELPVFPGSVTSTLRVAFHEGPESFEDWSRTEAQAGTAEVVRLAKGTREYVVLRSFSTSGDELIVSPPWSDAIATLRPLQRAVWLRLPALPVLSPYEAPATWGDLRRIAAQQGVELDAALRPALAAARRFAPTLALVGFPVPALSRGEPERLHWQPVVLPILSSNRAVSKAKGRRGEDGRWQLDRHVAFADSAPLAWGWAENWHPDQLGSRGRFAALPGQRVVVIGAGALGSMVSELLVRAGVTSLAIFDADELVAGNLVRHTLVSSDLGTLKSFALRDRLNWANPNADISAFSSFSPTTAEARAWALSADLLIDTTGSHDVVEAMAAFEWPSSIAFASVSVLYAAEHLLLFLAEGRRFPLDDFDRAVQPWLEREREAGHEFPQEGIGCWHPVFPARADHIWQLASVAVSAVEARLGARPWLGDLYVYRRGFDQDGLPSLERVE